MIVERLNLVDFRNYRVADVELQAGPNVFVGSNGQGKTNLAEAIAFLATLGSHRVSNDAPLVRDGAEAAIVRARLAHGHRSVLLEVQINRRGSNKARVNGAPAKPADLVRYAQIVLFAPEDLQIVRGDPSARRRFVDQLLVQRAPRMSGVLGDYDRVLRQRNALLKSARARGIRADGLSTLDVWDEKLVELGAQIMAARAHVTAELSDPVTAAYAAIAGADHAPRLSWSLSAAATAVNDDEESGEEGATGESASDRGHAADLLRTALSQRRSAELERGMTLVGPHRDDLILRVRGLPVKGYASHGESWSVALALRLAEAQLLREHSQLGDPIVILDDVFAELDVQRRRRLADLVADFQQLIVTAAVEPDVPDRLRAHVVRVTAGTIVDAAPPDATGPDAAVPDAAHEDAAAQDAAPPAAPEEPEPGDG